MEQVRRYIVDYFGDREVWMHEGGDIFTKMSEDDTMRRFFGAFSVFRYDPMTGGTLIQRKRGDDFHSRIHDPLGAFDDGWRRERLIHLPTFDQFEDEDADVPDCIEFERKMSLEDYNAKHPESVSLLFQEKKLNQFFFLR